MMDQHSTNNKKYPAGPYSPWAPGIKPKKKPDLFVIEVLGCINEDWSEWFHNLEITCFEKKGITMIHGKLKDQAELFSILIKLKSLGLTLLRLNSNA
jgi:hypothetical protein